jgi:hypothetical protein
MALLGRFDWSNDSILRRLRGSTRHFPNPRAYQFNKSVGPGIFGTQLPKGPFTVGDPNILRDIDEDKLTLAQRRILGISPGQLVSQRLESESLAERAVLLQPLIAVKT